MIFSQVALGHVKEIRGSTTSSDSEVANSIMAAGKHVPTPGKELILPEGRKTIWAVFCRGKSYMNSNFAIKVEHFVEQVFMLGHRRVLPNTPRNYNRHYANT